ncbi:MAG TPA: hypothetical protein VK453_15340 [Micromonosporaceae bacterium]|nr:hypothetical protein [Micromonosporaceae bacterium]
MDPRQNAPVDPDAAWFSGERGRPEPDWERERWAGTPAEPVQYDPERYRSTDSHPLADAPASPPAGDGYFGVGRDDPLAPPQSPVPDRQPYPQPLHGQPAGAEPPAVPAYGAAAPYTPTSYGTPAADNPYGGAGQYGATPYGATSYGAPTQHTGERRADSTGEIAVEPPSRHYATPLDVSALRRGAAAPVTDQPPPEHTDAAGTGSTGARSTGSVDAPTSGAGNHGGNGATAVVPAEPRSRSTEPAGSVYRSRRSGVVGALIALTVLFELPALRAFLSSALADTVIIGDVVASTLLIIALPMLAMGLYGLITGAAAAPGQGPRVWLRTPLAYLPVALVLLVAGALAAR